MDFSAIKPKNITVYVYNIVEDEWDFLNAYTDSSHRLKDIEDSESTREGFFLAAAAAAADFVYISPQPIAADFQTYARSLFNYKHGQIIVPKTRTHELCLDLIQDPISWRRLITLALNYQHVTLLAYSATPQFYRLMKVLAKACIKFRTPETPSLESAWTVNFFGSKSGIRQMAGLAMPDGLICSGKLEASRIAAGKYIKNHGVVIKSNNGSSSNGLLIYRKNSLPDNYSACAAKLEAIFGRESYWEKFPVVVEDLINVNSAIDGGFPSIEFKIKGRGRVEMLFHGVLAVTDKGEYYGMDVNESILPKHLKTQMLVLGNRLAKQYAAAGYRGHFDIDMIAAKNGRLYISESNTRNTGWTDIYKIVKKLIGNNWFNQVYVLNREYIRFPKNRRTNLNDLLTGLSSLIYSPQTKKGIIINSEAFLKSKYLYYTIIAPDKQSAYACQKKMMKLLGN